MSAAAYDLAVRLSFQAAGVGSSIATMTALFASLEKQALATGSAVNKLGLVAGAALTGLGIGGVVVMKEWVTQAGKMQEALTQVGLVAKGTQSQLNDLYNQSFTVASQTQFSAPDILQMESVMARMGYRDLSGQQTQRQVIGAAIPEFARAAEIESHFNKTGTQDTTTALTQMAHMFGAYSGAALAQNVALAVGASMSSGTTLPEQSIILRYLMPANKTLGMTSEDTLALAALANQVGLARSGRGASNVGALFRYMTDTGTAAHKEGLAAVEQYGGGTFFKNGAFEGVGNALRVINRFLTNPALTQEQRSIDLTTAFRVQGAQAASVLGNTTATKQYAAILASIQTYTPDKLRAMQNALNQTLQGQIATLNTNLQSISAMLGKELIPAILTATHAFVQLTSGMIAFGQQHPTIVKVVAAVTALGSVLAIVGGAVLIGTAAWGALSVAAGAAAIAFGALDAALLPILIPIGAIALAVTGVILLFTHWHDISKLLGDMIGWVGGQLHDFLVFLGLVQNSSKATAAAAASNGAQGTNGTGQQVREVVGPGREVHWVPVPPKLPYHPAVSHPHHWPPPHTGGGSVPHPGTAAPDIHVHVHGVDHQTAASYGKTIAGIVREHLSRGWSDERNFGGNLPYAMDLGPLPY